MKKLNDVCTRNELADFLKIPRRKLSHILYIIGVENSYTSFNISKKNGGVRNIYAPTQELKCIQQKLANALYTHRKLSTKNPNNISHGFEEGRSIITNASVHRNKNIVLTIDLEDFFESFHFGRVRGFFLKNKNFLLPIEVATVIAQLACYKGKLPQGSPASPIISNLICEILDYRISKITKKYKLKYTRYADDLTFSTNDNTFISKKTLFCDELERELVRAGFSMHTKKKRLQLKDSRQIVTGLIVNHKVNVNRIYYKKTRAMAHSLYTKSSFEIEGIQGDIKQLEGRFSFINQLTWYNNILDSNFSRFNKMKSRELLYQEFLFYKYFYANPKPVIITEGKTDVLYLKAALQSLYKDYPELIKINNKGQFEYKVSFLKRTKRLDYFLGLVPDGADAIKNIYNLFVGKDKSPNYLKKFFNTTNRAPENPVFLLYDNELDSGKKKPIGNFLGHVGVGNDKRLKLETDLNINLIGNLYLLTVPLIKGKPECEIEDLFDNTCLAERIVGKSFNRNKNFNNTIHFGKEIFSKFVFRNYTNINFNEFRPVLDNIKSIVNVYSTKDDKNKDVLNVEEKSISSEKVFVEA